MSSHYLLYAKPTTGAAQLTEGEPLRYVASNQLSTVEPRDTVWLVSAPEGQLTVLGRVRVDRIVGGDEAERHLGSGKIWEADGLGSKGVLTTMLARGTQRLAILNTHLQSAYSSGRYADIRARQVEELQVEVERLPLPVPVIAAGDLNTLPSEPLYRTLERRWIDLGRAERRACGCGTSFLPDGREGGWIDYILFRRTPEWRTQITAFDLIRNARSDDD